MRQPIRSLVLLAPLALAACAITPASTPPAAAHTPTPVRYPEFLEQYAATSSFRLGQPKAITPTPQGDAVLFLRSAGPRSFVQDLWLFDVAAKSERVLLTAEQILAGKDEVLTPEELARRERMRMSSRGISSYDLSDDGNHLLVPLSGRLFAIDLTDRHAPKTRELKSDAGFPIDPQFASDGTKVVTVRNNDLYAFDLASNTETRLTTGGTDAVSFGTAEFVAQEEMDRRHGYWISPDSKTIAYQRTDTSKLETFTIADAANPGKSAQSWPYPRAGKANADVTLGLMPITGGATTWVDWDRVKYPYLARVDWPNNAPLTILVQSREQTEQLLLKVDPATGRTATLLRETDPAWINLFEAKWLRDGSGFLWTTEQDARGTNDRPRLELRNADGRLDSTLLDGRDNFKIAGFDHTGTAVILTRASDYKANQIWSYPIARGGGGAARHLGELRPHTFHAPVLSKRSDLWVCTESCADGSTDVVVGRGAGEIIGSIKSIAEEPPFMAAPEWTTVRAEGSELNAAVIRPRDFDRNKRYPVLNAVYGGPHSNVVTGNPRSYLLHQWIADQGFIVVALDARGTPGKGRAWERAIKNNVIDIPLAEQAAGTLALCAARPEMDSSRVGMYGWSFGGYFSVLAAERRPDVFKAAVAIAPVADWRDYDTHYTERYMGLPDANKAGYDAASALTYAKDLRVPLMIMHGTADDNVYTINSLRLTDALFREGKPFEFVPLSGFTHSVTEPKALSRLWERAAQFFKRNLGEPR